MRVHGLIVVAGRLGVVLPLGRELAVVLALGVVLLLQVLRWELGWALVQVLEVPVPGPPLGLVQGG